MINELKNLGKFEIRSDETLKLIPLSDLKEGINDAGNFIIKLKGSRIDYIVNKTCDHTGGRLIVKGDKAICPMHNWTLDLHSLEYNNSHLLKEKVSYKIKDGFIQLQEAHARLHNPFKSSTFNNKTITFRWLNHATLYFEYNGVSLITDPWLFGPAFMTGWWLSSPSPSDSIELLKKADYVFISHNHPDHLHPETLACLDKDSQFIVADFNTKSTERYLRKLGFGHIHALDFNDIIELVEGFQVSILKSGDFRDDSGIYLCLDNIEFLLTVDANFLNAHDLPHGIDFLMTSFAGGASGFPLCFNDYNEDEKKAIVERNRNSIKFGVAKYLEKTRPKYYMPYAGMFQETSDRDRYIKERNIKNSTGDYELLSKNNNALFLQPGMDVVFKVNAGKLTQEPINIGHFEQEDPKLYIDNLKKEYQFSADRVIAYFQKSNFHDKLLLQLIPGNDDFSPKGDTYIHADFSKQAFTEKPLDELLSMSPGLQVTTIRVRSEVLMCVIENSLPWEDLSIGFQMSVNRFPKTYESNFWYHFTNVFIAQENFRYSSYCGSCTVIDQNPIWNKISRKPLNV